MLQQILPVLRSALVMIVGGGFAAFAGMPSPWLVGPMILGAAVSISGFSLSLPAPVQFLASIVIGIALGTGVNPAALQAIPSWPASIALVLVATVAITMCGQIFFQRAYGWDRASAFFSSIPGALTVLMVAAADTGVNLRRVAMAQSLRLFLLMAVLPIVVSAMEGGGDRTLPAAILDPREFALVLAASAGAIWLFIRIKLPAASIFGGLAASAALHGSGTVHLVFPPPLLYYCFAIMGVMVGGRFGGITLRELRDTGIAACGGCVVSLVVSAIFVVIAAALLDIPLAQLLLAFAPGGLDSMSSLAIMLHLDTAFVAIHQLTRVLFIMAVLPVCLKALGLSRKP